MARMSRPLALRQEIFTRLTFEKPVFDKLERQKGSQSLVIGIMDSNLLKSASMKMD